MLPKEKKISSKHPKSGHDLIVNLPHLEKVAKIIANQNKHFDFDEKTSPSCDSEVSVPFGVQVLRVVKDFDAFVSSGTEPAEVLNRIREKKTHYKPFVVDALFSIAAGQPVREIRSLKIEEISIGMILVENITIATEQIIYPKGTEIDITVLNRINNFSLEMEINEPVKVIVPSTKS